MEVQIISKEWIKPSSPTNIKNLNLSFLDIMLGSGHFPAFLYYPTNQDTNLSPSDIVSERLQVLKQSLSETLSIFYPFAGKIKDSYSIDCNDEGVYFVEAKVKSALNEFLSNPNIFLIRNFLPHGAKWKSTPGDYVLGIQVTAFACGGIAVGLYLSHAIADGTALASFLKGWAAVARKSTDEAICPKFDTSSLFPYKGAFPKDVKSNPLESSQMIVGKCITRRYVFDASAIAKLKAKAKNSCQLNPTRVEVVTAFFVKIFEAVRSGSDKPLTITHGVNLRRKAVPPLSEYMGNFVWITSIERKEKEVELGGFVCQMREAIAKLNADFVNSLQGEEGWLNYLEALKCLGQNFSDPQNVIAFGSWCNFALYDIDFGWGKPIWASKDDLAETARQVGALNIRAINFMDTRHNDGVEVWACLPKEDVAMLEHDKEFLEFATVNPSPLNIM